MDNQLKEEVVCFLLNSIVYVPHHFNKKLFVGPGFWEQNVGARLAPPVYKFSNKKYSAQELVQAGAKAQKHKLFVTVYKNGKH